MTYKSYHDATTRSSVLMAVKNTGDEAAWARFFDLYAGFVFAIARKKGLVVADADELVQNVFTELAQKMPNFEYDRAKGKFRSYLIGLVNWRVTDFLKAHRRDVEQMAKYMEETGSDGVSLPSEEDEEREWQNAAFDEAMRRLQKEVRPDHFAAFVESTVEGIDVDTVMRLHGLSRDNLYQIRKRFTDRLKPLVATVLKEMDEGCPPPLACDESHRR